MGKGGDSGSSQGDGDGDSGGGQANHGGGQAPKGTEFGFPQLTAEGAEVPRPDATDRATLPAPRGRPPSRLRIEANPAVAEPEAPPVLRRVEHELAEPPRFTTATHTGRELMRDSVEAGLLPIKSEELIKQDLLAPEQLPAWQRMITALTWTRGRLLATIAVAVAVVALIVVLVVLASRSAPERGDLASAKVPGGAAAADDPSAEGQPDDKEPLRAAKTPPPGKDDPDVAYDEALAKAHKQLDQGFCPDAATALVALTSKRPADAKARLLLGRALVCQGKHRQGLAAYQRALAGDKRLGDDKQVLNDLAFLLSDKKSQAAAITLAATIGKPAELLLVGAATSRSRDVRSQAVRAMLRIGAADKVDWSTSLWLDLQQTSCADRPAVIEQIVARVQRSQAIKLLQGALRGSEQACVREQLKATLATLRKKK